MLTASFIPTEGSIQYHCRYLFGAGLILFFWCKRKSVFLCARKFGTKEELRIAGYYCERGSSFARKKCFQLRLGVEIVQQVQRK